jgi:hypothetical protein
VSLRSSTRRPSRRCHFGPPATPIAPSKFGRMPTATIGSG